LKSLSSRIRGAPDYRAGFQGHARASERKLAGGSQSGLDPEAALASLMCLVRLEPSNITVVATPQ
jgi:hypothetical protein